MMSKTVPEVKEKMTYEAIIVVAAYNCRNCNRLQRVDQEGSKFMTAPEKCSICGGKSFDLNVVQSDFVDAETGEYYGD